MHSIPADPSSRSGCVRRLSALALTALPWLAVLPAHAQTAPGKSDGPLTLDASIRARFETIDGQFRPGAPDTGALMLRTLLRAEYKTGAVRIGAELQDARVYFEHDNAPIGTTEVDTVEPIQAYLAVRTGRTTEWTLGRMTMDLGSRRFVSRQAFRNSTNAYTGVRFDWRPEKGSGVTAFWTMPQDRMPNDSDAIHDNRVKLDRERLEQQFFGFNASKAKLVGNVGVELFGYRLVERDAPNFATRNRRLWTVGGRVLRAPARNRTDFEFEGAWQGGTTHASAAATDRTALPVDARFIHAALGHSFAAPWSPRVQIAYDYASGDTKARSYGRFDTLFGARVFEYGPSSLYGPIARANLQSVEARVELKPGKRADGYLAVRPLWLASATDSFAGTGVKDAKGLSGRYAGTQIDARLRRWLMPDRLRLGVGAAVLIKGRFLTDAPNAPTRGDTHYAFSELTLTL